MSLPAFDYEKVRERSRSVGWRTPSNDQVPDEYDTEREYRAHAVLSVHHDKTRKEFSATLYTEQHYSYPGGYSGVQYDLMSGVRLYREAVGRYSDKARDAFLARALEHLETTIKSGHERTVAIMAEAAGQSATT